ncbi:MAG: hypothetical protein NZM37_01750 [Sandaracinaceae bacterium]|nr:hypothetical protein [Sandaracinaceae bacterium]
MHGRGAIFKEVGIVLLLFGLLVLGERALNWLVEAEERRGFFPFFFFFFFPFVRFKGWGRIPVERRKVVLPGPWISRIAWALGLFACANFATKAWGNAEGLDEKRKKVHHFVIHPTEMMGRQRLGWSQGAVEVVYDVSRLPEGVAIGKLHLERSEWGGKTLGKTEGAYHMCQLSPTKRGWEVDVFRKGSTLLVQIKGENELTKCMYDWFTLRLIGVRGPLKKSPAFNWIIGGIVGGIVLLLIAMLLRRLFVRVHSLARAIRVDRKGLGMLEDGRAVAVPEEIPLGTWLTVLSVEGQGEGYRDDARLQLGRHLNGHPNLWLGRLRFAVRFLEVLALFGFVLSLVILHAYA